MVLKWRTSTAVNLCWVLFLSLGLAVAATSCQGAEPIPTLTTSGPAASPTLQSPAGTVAPAQHAVLVLPLFERNASGKLVVAVLTAQGDRTDVVMTDRPISYGAVQPAHIYTGTCDRVGGVVYALQGALDGSSTTTLNASLDKLQQGTYVINMHESAARISNYIACGAIPTKDDAATVKLQPIGDSGQSGYATLIRHGEKTTVALSVDPVQSGEAQPVHIHSGACANPGVVVHPLADLAEGISATEVGAPLDGLLMGNFAIALHPSAAGLSTHTACGEIQSP